MSNIRKVVALAGVAVIVGAGCGDDALTNFGNPGPTESCQKIGVSYGNAIPTVEVRLPDGDGEMRTVCLAGYAPEWLP